MFECEQKRRAFFRSNHDGLLVVDGAAAVDEPVDLRGGEWRSLPAVLLRGRHHVDVGEQHVGRQGGVRAMDPEQVAVIHHHFMLDQVRGEHYGER